MKEVDTAGDQMGYTCGWSHVWVSFWAIRRSVILEPSLNNLSISMPYLCSSTLCLLRILAFTVTLVDILSLVLTFLPLSWVFMGIPTCVLRRYCHENAAWFSLNFFIFPSFTLFTNLSRSYRELITLISSISFQENHIRQRARSKKQELDSIHYCYTKSRSQEQ